MNTQQKQLQARIRRREKQALFYHDKYFMHNGMHYNWARLGLYNVRHEVEHSANVIRLFEKGFAVEYGSHWMTWSKEDEIYVQPINEQITRDKLGNITSCIYLSDLVSFTPHAVERVWQRSGVGIDKHYTCNLGLKNLEPYIGTFAKHTMVMDEIAFRRDIVVPFMGGCFLGCCVRSSCPVFGAKKQGNQVFRVIAHPDIETFSFRAETWISGDMMSQDQRRVCELLLKDQIDDAIDYMRAMPIRNCEAYDPNQFENVSKQARSLEDIVNELVKNA